MLLPFESWPILAIPTSFLLAYSESNHIHFRLMSVIYLANSRSERLDKSPMEAGKRDGWGCDMRFATPQLRQLRIADEGQALVLTALALVVLMLMAGLGVDVGFLRYQKQQMQKAADAGAIAGASALIYNGKYKAAAQADSSANGFTSGNNGIVVTVNMPPASGPNQSKIGFVEVIVSQLQPTFFMRLGGFTSVPVSARAVASALGTASGCIYALDPTESDTFDVRGNVTITSACGIFINSDDPLALGKAGNSGIVKASYVGIVGNESQSNLNNVISEFTLNQQPVTGMAPVNDPLASVPPPTPLSGCADQNPPNNAFTPGTYCGGLTIHGNGTYTFAPGLYTLLGGGFTASGNLTFTGTGVTFYNSFDGSHPYGGISLHGNVVTAFSAPTDSSNGGVPGILFFQDRRVPVGSASSDFGGNNDQVYTGALYFPTTLISYKGTPGLESYTIMVGWKLEFRGTVVIDDYLLLPGGVGPIRNAFMAE
jgi:hypothetical protein